MFGLLILFAFALVLLIALLTLMLAWEMRHPPRHTAAYAIARSMAADPGELNLPFDSWSLDRADGTQLLVWEIQNPESKAPNSFTAVFIHGWGHSRIDSLARVKPLDELCDRIVMYDLRGHGESNGTARLGDSEDTDLLALLDRLGQGPFILVGHSMGAVIALKAAMAARADSSGSRIAGVIASAPYCEFHRSLIGRLCAAGFPTRPITDLALLVHRVCGVRPARLNDAELQSLAVPVLVIHGTDDAVAPVHHGERIVAAVPDCTMVEIPEARHADAHVVGAEHYNRAVQDFVARIAATAPCRM
jgi:pimeloyl-ACP methyl ester carboxylesterase